MPHISNAFLVAVLSLVPAALADPASAFVQLAETQDGAATASVQHDAASLGQARIKELFFDAARTGRDDLLDGLIQSGMKPDERDAKGYTALIIAAYNGQAKSVDLLISPATPTTAFPLGEKVDDPLAMYLFDLCTLPLNLAGHCGMSVPSGLSPDDNLPVGLQIMAPALADDRLYRVGAAYEAARGPLPTAL